MKTTNQIFRPALKTLGVLLAAALCSPSAFATTINKADNAEDLNLTNSWSDGVVPGAADVARWDSTVEGANSVLLGANASWLGLVVADPGGAVTIGAGNTLTLGTSGIDMSAATQDLTISSGLTLGAGSQTWTVATGRTLTHNTGTLTRSTGATLLVDKSTVTGTVTANPTLLNSVVPWAVIKSSGTAANNSANGHTFATVSGGSIVAYTAATAVTTGYPASSATANYDWSATGTQGLIGSSRSANTIRFTGTSAVLQQVNSPQTETMNALMNAGGGTVTLGGGAQTMNIQAGSANELVLAAVTSGIIINGPIINTSGGVTVVGPNTVTFGGANSYTGPTRVNSGTLKLGAANRLPDGSTVTVNGTLDMATFSDTIGGLDGSGTVDNSAAGTPTLTVNSTASSTFGGLIKNTAGTLALTKTGSGTLTLSGANNTYSGATTIGASGGAAVLRASATQSLGAGAIFLDGTGNASTARLETTGGISLNNAINFPGRNNSSVGIQSIAGNNTLSGAITLNSGGSVYQIQSDADTLTLGTAAATAITAASGSRVVTLQGAGNGSVVGNIINGGGTVGVTKTGAGTWTLTGANGYTGVTTISQGTLALSGSATLATPQISIASGATFDVSGLASTFTLGAGQSLTNGTGSVNGSVATSSGTAAIYAGAFGAVGTLTFNSTLNMSAGGAAYFDVSTTFNSGNDQIVVGGDLTLSSSDVIHINALGGAANLDTTGDYALFAVAGTTTIASQPVLVWDGTAPANSGNFVLTTSGNNVVLQYISATAPAVTATAEPASATRNQPVVVTATVTPGSSSNIVSVNLDASAIGGSPATSLVLSNDFIYTNTVIVSATTSLGPKSLTVLVTDDTTPVALNGSYNLALTVVVGNKTWDGGALADDNWSSNPNWTSDVGPAPSGDSVTFAGTTRLTPGMDASYAVTGVTFDATAGSFTLGTSTSRTLTNGSSGIVNNSTNSQTVNVPIVLTAAQSLNAAAGDLAFGGAVAYGANTLAVPGASNVTFSSSLSGTADFNKTGAGTLAFGGSANAGQFNLDKGTVNLTGTMTATGGGNRIRVGNGAGNVGVLNVESGAVATANWSLVAGSDTSTGTINVNGGTLVRQGNINIYLGSGGSGSTGYLNLNSGVISNLAGGMIIGEGGASVGVYNQVGGTASLGGDLIVGQTTNINQFNLSGGTASAVNLFLGRGNGAGTATLTGGALSLSGIARVGDGVNASSTGTGLLTVSNTAVLNVENDLVLGFAGAGNLGRMVIEGGTVNVASTTTRWLILGQWDTTRGQLDINGGQLNLNAGTSLKYSIGGSGTASTNVVNLNGGSITFFSDNGTTIGGGGMVDLAQSGSANARNTFNLNGGTLTTPSVGASSTTPTRTFNFNGGTLRAAASSATFLQGLSTANVQAGGAVIDSDDKTITIAQNLLDGGGGGGLTKLGTGTLYLNGVNTYIGDTVVNAGTLGGSGTLSGAVTVNSGGTLAPGTSIGTLTINNELTLAGDTALEINKAAGPVLTSDLVTGLTELNCGGTVTVTATGDALAAGDEFTVFNAGAFNGAFTSITPAPGAGLAWDATKLAAEGKLLVHANPVANADEAGATHGQTTTIAMAKLLMNDAGEPGETLSVIGVSANASLAGGIVTYTAPASGASDVITYTLSDGRGGTATGTINVALSTGAGGFNQLAASILGNGDLQLTYLGIPGTNYALEVTHDLGAPVSWTPVVTNAAGANGLLIFTNTPSLAPTNDYYRTRYAP